MSKYILSGGFEHQKKSIKVTLSMFVFQEDDSYIVYCPALDLSAYGESEENAQKAFEEKFEITFKYCMNKNTLKEDLKKHGWDVNSLNQRRIKAPSLNKMLKINEAFKDMLNNKEFRTYKQDVGLPELA